VLPGTKLYNEIKFEFVGDIYRKSDVVFD